MRAGTVEFAIVGDTRQFDTSLRQSEETAKVYAERTEKQFKRVQTSLEDIAKTSGMPLSELKKLEDQARKSLASFAASKDIDMLTKRLGLTTESAKELEKAMGLTSKQASSFAGKTDQLQGSMLSLKDTVGLAATAFGAFKLAEFAKDTALAAARYETLGVVMNVVGKNAGITSQTMNAVSQALQGQGIAMNESREATIKLTQAGIDLSKASELGRLAQDAAVIANMNSSEAFMHMVYAIQSAQPEMLRTIGLNVNFEASYEKMAVQLGVTKEALTEQEKMQARVNATLAAASQIAGTYEAAMGTAGKQIKSFERYLSDLKTVGGEALQEGLSRSVELATKKIKDLTEYLQTGEAKARIAEIGKSSQEAFESLVKVGEVVGTVFGATLGGWNALPEIIKEVGIVAAVVGGAKARAALALVGLAISSFKELSNTIDALAANGSGNATLDQQIKALEYNINAAPGAEVAAELQPKLDALKEQRRKVKDFEAQSRDEDKRHAELLKRQVGLGNTKPNIPVTFEDLEVQSKKAFGGGSSNLSDETRRNEAFKEFNTRYALALRMYGMAQGDSAKMSKAIAVERDAYHALGKELESITGKKGEGIEKANAEATKIINEARGKAMAAQADLLGDKWGQKEAQAATEYQKSLDSLEVKLVGFKGTEKDLMAASLKYWAEYEYGVKKAQIAFDQWADEMKTWGDLMNQIGTLSFDPGKQFDGQLTNLQAERAKALKEAGDNQEKIAAINEMYALKEIDLREKSFGEMAKLDDTYWQRRRDGLDAQYEYLKKSGANEPALAVYYAQEKDKLAKSELEARIGYEDNFGSYLSDRLALNYGLYKSEQGRLLDTWAKTADSIIKAFDGIEGAVSTVFGAGLTDIITGKFQGMQHYIDSMLSSLKQVLISWLADMAKIAMHNYIVVPIMGQIMGTEGSFDLEGGSTGSSKSSGFSLSSASKYAGYAKDGYSLYNSIGNTAGYSASALGSASSAFGNTMSTTSLTGYQALHAADSAAVSSLTSTGGFSAGIAPGAAGAGIGYMAGSFIRPDNPTASYVGAGAGLAGGAIAGMAGLGALSATGVGALVAIPAALVAGLATPETTKSTWNTQPGSGQAVFIINGDVVPTSYGVLKQTTSGMFGSESTTHQTVFQAASGELATTEQSSWAAATAGLNTFTSSLNIGSKQVEDATKGFVFPMTAVPSGMEADTYKNIANAETEYTLQNLGLIDSIKAVAKEGEYYIDTVTRIGSALSVADSITQATGFSFERLTGSMDKIQSGDYISRLTDAAGSIEAVQTTLGLLTSHTMSNAGRTEAAIANMTEQANQHLIELGVSFDDFWNRMQAAMSGPIDPETFAAWGEAAKLVDQLNTLQKSMDSVNMAAKQFDASLSARALSAQGFTYQAQIVSMLASQEAELTQARLDGASAAQLSRLAEVQAMETAAMARQHAEQGENIRSGLAQRIAEAAGDTMYQVTTLLAAKGKDYTKIVWEYGYELADMSNKAYDMEIQSKLTSMAETKRLATESFQIDIRSRQLTLAGKEDEAGAIKLIAEQAEQYHNAIASGLGAEDLNSLLQVQRDELTAYWGKLVDELKSAADALHKTVLELRSGDKSPLDPAQRYALIRSQFDADVAKGMTGDRTAITEAQNLASNVLDALMATTTDKSVYASGFNEITGALNSLAAVLVGVQQKDAIAQAEAAYTQAKTQAETAFRSTMEGQITQGLAYTGAGAGAVGDLLISGYGYTGGLTVDAYLRDNPGKVSDYIGWFQQNYGMTGSGQYDAWTAMQTLISGGVTPAGTSDLYSAALSALENLKKVRGYAGGRVTTGPELAMIGERDQEAIIPMQNGAVRAVVSGGGSNSALLARIDRLTEEVRQLREENNAGHYATATNTATSAKWATKSERIGTPPVRTA